jgi:hypothetical protein
MYQAIVLKGGEAADVIAVVRNWSRPLWGMLSVLWGAMMVTLFYLYVSPHTAPPTIFAEGSAIDLDKVFHMVAHACTIALPLAVVPYRRLAWTMGAFAIVAAFGFEFCQLWVPQRSFDIGDMAANFAGLAIGARLGLFVRELYPRLP